MARRWLVLVLLAAGGTAEAKYEPPRPTTDCAPPLTLPVALRFEGGPAKPTFTGAAIYVYDHSHSVERLEIEGATFAPDTRYVRIRVLGQYDSGATADTTPGHLVLCDPPLWTQGGEPAAVTLTAIDDQGRATTSDPVTVIVAIDRDHPRYPCALGDTVLYLLGMVVLVGLLIGALVVLVVRSMRKPRGAPEPISLLVGEHIARIALVHQLVMVAVGVGGTVFALATDAPVLSLLPILVLGFGLIDAHVVRRALHRLEQPGATAELYDNALVVQDARGHTRVSVSRRTMRRGRARGLASAHIRRAD